MTREPTGHGRYRIIGYDVGNYSSTLKIHIEDELATKARKAATANAIKKIYSSYSFLGIVA
jgi:hypothetical protein